MPESPSLIYSPQLLIKQTQRTRLKLRIIMIMTTKLTGAWPSLLRAVAQVIANDPVLSCHQVLKTARLPQRDPITSRLSQSHFRLPWSQDLANRSLTPPSRVSPFALADQARRVPTRSVTSCRSPTSKNLLTRPPKPNRWWILSILVCPDRMLTREGNPPQPPHLRLWRRSGTIACQVI